ncbi:protein tyrosine phosphatase type IVA 3 isoform X2 [Spea bombifrons]|uniref:protein tyrosine phosphatase type IVA 3 isoform X2 n=1 Tax=Spea bombifrons TaxID=233779 RepID=UPI002349CB24|nr:protein tyrosine phosphatase type IVA 3 isoform X2 [Spea bombifrons]
MLWQKFINKGSIEPPTIFQVSKPRLRRQGWKKPGLFTNLTWTVTLWRSTLEHRKMAIQEPQRRSVPRQPRLPNQSMSPSAPKSKTAWLDGACPVGNGTVGRAPVLVALALIESGMKYEDAIQFIRQKRRGAINSKQLTYLEKYRPKQRLRFKDPHNHKNKCCIM